MGRVKSLSRITTQNRILEERIIALKTSSGYPSVLLAKDGAHKYFDVHRLVAKTFIDNPENKPMVNHMDGNKANGCWWNLEWVTSQENLAHAIANNLIPPRNEKGAYEPKNPEPILTESDRREIKGTLNLCIRGLADRFKVRPKKIRAIAKRLTGSDTMLKPTPVKCDSNNVRDGYLTDELPQKAAGMKRGGEPEK